MRSLTAVGLALTCLFAAVPVPRAQQPQGARVAAAGAAATSPRFAAAREAAERITAEEMKEILYVIASDEYAGRDTPSAGLDKTARLIAEHLRKLKVKPAGDKGSYFQRIAMTRTEVDRELSAAQVGGRSFKIGVDFLPVGRVSGEADAPLVYAGHGWVIRSRNLNPYEGVDVRGRVVVVSGDGVAPPPGVPVSSLRAGDWESPVSYAQKHGARALVLVPRNFDRRWRYGSFAISRASYSIPRLEGVISEDEEGEEPAAPAPGVVSIIPSRAMLDELFAGERLNGAAVLAAAQAPAEGESPQAFALSPDKRLRLSVKLAVTEASTQNIVGVIEGKDPKLRKEYVALGAHYDHVGASGPSGCRPVDGDSICNGADDDASGTTGLLAMAEAFTKGPRPRRSILLVWHTGEEKGLWGSEYYTRYPTVPLGQLVAQLNIDMIGRSKKAGDTNPANRMLSGPDEIYVIGSRMMSTQLGELSEAVNRDYLGLKFNYHYDDPGDPERLFYRSDHFNYAKKGVPIVFFFDGVHEDYHKPTDSADKIDYRKLQNVTRTVFVLASELANAAARPVVDKQIPASRLQR